jgi:hypothetical protein
MKSRFLSYGAGMQTFALLVMAEQGEIQVDEVVFADTGAEHPETYEHIEKVAKPICERIGIPFTTVRMNKTVTDISMLQGDVLKNYKDMLKRTEDLTRKNKAVVRSQENMKYPVKQKTVTNLRDEIIARRRVPSINPQSRWCMPPEQLIVTADGLRSISSIKIGDQVLTGNGRYKKVLNVFTRDYDGKLVKIRPHGYTGPEFETYLTPEHKVFAKRLGYKKYKGVGERTVSPGEWIEAGKLFNQEIVLSYPRLKETEDKDISDELLRLIGYYLAEGYISDRVYFTFGKNLQEAGYAQEVFDMLTKLGYSPRLYFHHTGYVVSCYGRKNGLVQFFRQFGVGSHSKKIPLWVKKLLERKIQLILDTYLLGDGHLTHEGKNNRAVWKASSVSLQLAWDIRDIALKCGHLSEIYRRDNHRESHIGSRIITGLSDIYEIRIRGNPNEPSLFRRYRFNENYIHGKPWEISMVDYKGIVYDLEVEDDHTFCAPSFIVSNCTSDSKLVPIHKGYIRVQQEKGDYVKPCIAYIGLSYEELTRMYKPHLSEYSVEYPLIDKKMTRKDCLKYVSAHGYESPPKSGCYFCPFQSAKQWGILYRNHPDLYWDSVDLEEMDLNFPTYKLNAKGVTLRKLVEYFSPTIQMTLDDSGEEREAMACEVAGYCGV